MKAEGQKFRKGDLVRIAKDLGASMSRFPSDCEAIVLGSYADQFGGNDTQSYTLFLKGRNEVSWYYESQLTWLEEGRMDLLEQWGAEIKAEIKIKADLDWIFAHGQEVISNPHDASVSKLANCLGLPNLWGESGEGFTYYRNSMFVQTLAMPFLESGDKEGWLSMCEFIIKRESEGLVRV